MSKKVKAVASWDMKEKLAKFIEDGDHRVGRSQVNADNLTHRNNLSMFVVSCVCTKWFLYREASLQGLCHEQEKEVKVQDHTLIRVQATPKQGL